jgi:predicted enzyme related to lactoylglutathione lyase
VDDLESAVARVRALGGRVDDELMEGPEGRHVQCADDQGVEFGLSQPADGY